MKLLLICGTRSAVTKSGLMCDSWKSISLVIRSVCQCLLAVSISMNYDPNCKAIVSVLHRLERNENFIGYIRELEWEGRGI